MKSNTKLFDQKVERLQGGLTKLSEAGIQVAEMQVTLSKEKAIIDEKAKVVAEKIQDIDEKSEIVGKRQAEAIIIQTDVTAKEIDISKRLEVADKRLEEAIPALELALLDVKKIEKGDLDQLKSFANPSTDIVKIVTACLYLNPTDEKINPLGGWDSAKKLLSTMGLVNKLVN